MKKFIAMLLALAMVIGWIAIPPTHAHAEEATKVEGENSTAVEPLDSSEPEVDWEQCLGFGWSEEGYYVSSCDPNASGKLAIPAVCPGGPVIGIGDNAFAKCVNLTDVTIPDSVTNIGVGAFAGCISLTSVTIPDGVTTIQFCAFEGCTSLTDVYYTGTKAQWTAITISDGNDPLLNANIVFLGEGAVEPTTVPTTAPTTEPTEATVEPTVAPTEAPAEPTDVPIEPTEVPVNPTEAPIEPSEAPTEPSQPEVDWESYLTFSMDTDGIGYFVSRNTDSVVSGDLTIPATYNGLPVIGIAAYGFSSCDGLTSVTIPDSVTSIGDYAFQPCKSLTSVTIPNSVTFIGWGAFAGCASLTDVYYTGTQEQWDAIEIIILNEPLLNANITFLGEGTTEPTAPSVDPIDPTGTPVEPTEPSEPEADWEQYLFFVLNEDGQSYRVSGCDTKIVGELTVPATYNGLPVTTIGDSAFSCCYELTGVVLPESITVIGSNAFANCHNLQSVNLPEGLVAIAEYAFASCDNLYEIQIPANVEYVGVGAFAACPLDGIWVDENNPNYANDEKGVLFSKDMTNLIAAPYGLTGSYAIPDGVEFICSSAFSNTKLSEVTFPDSVVEIGYSAFNNCYLTEIVIGNGVLYIGMDAFANCEYLTAVTIPDSVTVIADYAFQNSPNVTFYCHIGAYAVTYADDFDIPVCYLDAVKEVSIATMPAKLVYPLDGHLNLNGLSLDVTLEDGTVVTIYNGYTVEPYDFSTAGAKTVTLSVGGVSVFFEVEVDAELIEYPESNHPYQNNSDITWKFTYPGDADMLAITFSADTKVEDSFDWIIISDSEGNETGYTGRELAGKKIVVPGRIFTIRFTSDSSSTEYGFAITSIEALKKAGLEKLTFTMNANATGYIITDCDETAEGVLDIPAEYEGLPVVGIGDNAFQNCAGLTGVNLAEGIGYIGNGAFGYCGNLQEITIPVSVTAIGDNAFLGCDNLTDVYYGGNRSQWNAIQMGENNDALSNAKLNIPQSVCEHTPGETVVVNEWYGGDCYDSKYQDVIVYCADCGFEMERKTITVPPTGHTPGDPVIENVSEAGCTNSGWHQEVTYCTECNKIISRITVTTDPTGHTEGWTEVNEQPASCTYVGYREWLTFCADCGCVINRETEEIPATGHTPGATESNRIEEPSCYNTGYIQTWQYCADCNQTIGLSIEILPVTDHIPGETAVEVDSYGSCTSEYIYYNKVYCQWCGRTLSAEKVVEPATGHIPGEAEILNERAAGCVNAGYRDVVVYCANAYCGMQLSYTSVFIPATGHTEEIIPGYAATCMNSGMTDGKYCTVCGATTQVQEWINPLGHTEEVVPGYAATCTEYGMTDGMQCTVCGETTVSQWEISPTGHAPGNTVVENETATSYDAVIYCETCGVELSREFVEIACVHGIKDTVIVETVPATCTESGYVVFEIVCLDCGEVLGGDADEIPALGHTPGKAVVENETATSYESVVYCETCGAELSRELVETACAHKNTTTATKTVPASCVTAGSVTTIVTCECGEVISETTEEIPATGVHTYTDDNDAVCNDCGYVRQMVDTFEFVNYRIVFSDSDTTHKNPRAIIYKLGDQTVEDPSNEKALKAIDPSAETIWQAAFINNILLTDAGNYVVMLKYNVGTATVSIPMVINITADPKLIIDKNNKLTVIDDNGANINHRVVVYYLGDETVDDIYNETALKAIDGAPVTVWQKKAINKLALTKGGNYVLHLCYNVGTGSKQTVAQTFTVFSIPTLTVNQNNMLVATEENAENKNHRVTVFYLGSKTVSDPFNETQVKNAAISSQTIWGLSAINKVEILQGGNYVFHMYYNVGTGAKRTLALEATLTERPALSVSEDNKLVVTYSDASITNPRAYIYNVGNKTVSDIYDETALKKIATPTQVWGLSSILRKQLTPGTYVIHLHYNVDGGVKSTVALKITIAS